LSVGHDRRPVASPTWWRRATSSRSVRPLPGVRGSGRSAPPVGSRVPSKSRCTRHPRAQRGQSDRGPRPGWPRWPRPGRCWTRSTGPDRAGVARPGAPGPAAADCRHARLAAHHRVDRWRAGALCGPDVTLFEVPDFPAGLAGIRTAGAIKLVGLRDGALACSTTPPPSASGWAAQPPPSAAQVQPDHVADPWPRARGPWRT